MPTTLSRSAYLNGLTGGLVRLLLALAGFLMTALTQEPGITFAAYLAGAYAVFALVHWATCLWQPRWTVPVTVVLDVAAAAGFVWLAPASMPGWVLLLFPVLLAGGAGLLPTLLAGSLAVVAYAAALLLAGTTPGGASVWPVVVLASAAIAIALLPSHWMSAGKERLAWAQAAVAEENYLRERALARIATDLTSFDRVTLEQVLVAAVHEGLRAVGQILERDAVPGPQDAPPEPCSRGWTR